MNSYELVKLPQKFDIVIDVDESELNTTIEENINRQASQVGILQSLSFEDKVRYINIIKDKGFLSVPSDVLDTNSQVKKLFEHFRRNNKINKNINYVFMSLLLVLYIVTASLVAFLIYLGYFRTS